MAVEDSEGPEGAVGGETAGERFSTFTKRNILLVSVFFLSNLLTAVSTLVTAVTVLRESRTDWHAAEYRKLSQLRAGYTLEKFQQELGPPVFRTALEGGGGPFVRNVYRPREQYWVEVISDKNNAAMTYAVTTCDPAFRPEFFYGGARKGRVVLNENTLSDVLPPEEQREESLKVYFGYTAGSPGVVFQVYDRGAASAYRQFAWGLNEVCPTWHSKTPGYDPLVSWAGWYQKHQGQKEPPAGHSFLAEELNEGARLIMAESVVNTYAESAVDKTLLTFYPKQIGVNRLVVQ
ncbi:ETEC_3214 domain-containing protein [Streptomyces sp. NPDC090303]|uniref:ETEC_3214 domain-containing protein n=1 Tax=Streptomyces sp. NPDC090303 TaxID=3365960 RepID=UPI0038192ACE